MSSLGLLRSVSSETPARVLAISLIPLLCVACTEETESAVPPDNVLALPDDPTEITIVQRMTDPVPGSHRRIRLEIGDITRAQVLTVLAIDDSDPLVSRRSMGIGDAVEFSVDGRRLSLGLARLVNLLIGDDHAIFYIGTPSAVATAQIEGFLKRIETSEYTFVRFGKEHNSRAMAGYLRSKWATMASAWESHF